LPGKRFSADCNALKFFFEKIPGPPLLEDIGALSYALTLLRRNGRGQFVANIFGRSSNSLGKTNFLPEPLHICNDGGTRHAGLF
jgi:hypothetical protein